MRLDRRDAYLYMLAATLGSFGLGVATFYLNFLYRALGYDGLALGALVGAQALGVAVRADATEARARSSRFGQQIALGTMAAFAASVVAGGLAGPVTRLLGVP